MMSALKSARRLLRPVLAGIGLGTAMVFAVSFMSHAAEGPALPNGKVREAQTQKRTAPEPQNLDAMVSEILERPLFSSSRQAPDETPPETQAAEEIEPPKMPGRLEGVAIIPGVKEALFEGDGDKPIAVKEGQEIQGWTVSSIKAEEVVLKNGSNEQVVKPADGAGVRRLANRAAAKRTQAQAQAKQPGPVIPGRTPPNAAGGPVLVKQPVRPGTSGGPQPPGPVPSRTGH